MLGRDILEGLGVQNLHFKYLYLLFLCPEEYSSIYPAIPIRKCKYTSDKYTNNCQRLIKPSTAFSVYIITAFEPLCQVVLYSFECLVL